MVRPARAAASRRAVPRRRRRRRPHGRSSGARAGRPIVVAPSADSDAVLEHFPVVCSYYSFHSKTRKSNSFEMVVFHTGTGSRKETRIQARPPSRKKM